MNTEDSQEQPKAPALALVGGAPAAEEGPPERNLLDLITGIKAGTVPPRTIPAEDRRACVGHLLGEGLTIPHIAQFLGRSEKTIERDKKEIQAANALRPDPTFAARMAGVLKVEAENTVNRLRRLAREKDCPYDARVAAERGAFQVLCEFMTRLQSMGYLPTAAQRLEASLTHQAADVPGLDQIEAEVLRLQAIVAGALPAGSAQAGEVNELVDLTNRAKLAARVAGVAATVEGTQSQAPGAADAGAA